MRFFLEVADEVAKKNDDADSDVFPLTALSSCIIISIIDVDANPHSPLFFPRSHLPRRLLLFLPWGSLVPQRLQP